MNRPYITCHMVTSIDGKVTGDFLFRSECKKATDVYYEINRERKCNGFICGRVTMEGSFTGGWYPDLSQYEPVYEKEDYIAGERCGFYAVAFDRKGKLGWKTDRIIDPDGDPGYDGAQIIEVLTEQADPRYLGYLREMGISYIFAGEKEIDTAPALRKLWSAFGAKALLLEGGSVVNGYFQRADAIDELSLVTAPTVAGADDKPLFQNSVMSDFELVKADSRDGVLILNYKRTKK